MREIKVDARGLSCPAPVIRTMKAMEELTETGVVETEVDNPAAAQNILIMAQNKGFNASHKKEAENHFVVRIEVVPGEDGEPAGRRMPDVSVCGEKGEFGAEKEVVVFGSEFMGSGSYELGAVLAKGFLYTLTQMDKKPYAILFYNSGVKLAVEGQQVEDLKKLEAEGVKIMSCGTCLSFYELNDRLAVGSVSNMYSILETLSEATKVIRP